MSSINSDFGQSQDFQPPSDCGIATLATVANSVAQVHAEGRHSQNPMKSNANVTRMTINENFISCQNVRSRNDHQVPNNLKSKFFSILVILKFFLSFMT